MFFYKIVCLYEAVISNNELTDPMKNALFIGLLLACIAFPYMLGSINFGIIISKSRFNDDVREHGSGNAGATNMLRTYGKGAAILTMAGDMFKSAVAITVGGVLLGGFGAGIAGFFCVMGHSFPCWYKFKGGKGVAATAVAALMFDPLTFVVLLLVFLVIVIGSRYVSLASVMGSLFFPLILSALAGPDLVIWAFLISVLVVFMHRGNIKRLYNKTEPKIEFGKKKEAEKPQETANADNQEPEEKKNITKNTSKKKLERRK
jgi:glycerol-3-phosphate acyltransferase PlsY